MFAYCNNNPVCLADSWGTDPIYKLDINKDGEDDCFVYYYFYDNFFGGETGIGYVYIFIGVDRSYFDDESNWPEGYDSRKDLLVAYIIEGKGEKQNPTLYAYQAQKIDKSHRADIVDLLLLFAEDYEIDWRRTADSLLTEWKEHNRYALYSKSAQDIDFDRNDEGLGFFDYLKRAIERATQ